MKKKLPCFRSCRFTLKEIVKRILQNYDDIELSTFGPVTAEQSVDYPDYAKEISRKFSRYWRFNLWNWNWKCLSQPIDSKMGLS